MTEFDAVKLKCSACTKAILVPRGDQQDGMVCPHCGGGDAFGTDWYGTATFEGRIE